MNDTPETPPNRRPSRAEKMMARARARVELEEICDDASELLSLENTKQFGIQYMLIWTALAAVVMAIFRAYGLGPAAAGVLGCVMAWIVYYTYKRERDKEIEIEQRLKEFRHRHRNIDVEEGMDVNLLWKLRNRRQ